MRVRQKSRLNHRLPRHYFAPRLFMLTTPAPVLVAHALNIKEYDASGGNADSVRDRVRFLHRVLLSR